MDFREVDNQLLVLLLCKFVIFWDHLTKRLFLEDECICFRYLYGALDLIVWMDP